MNSSIRTVLGIDLGTSSLKCIILDAAGRVRANAQRTYPTQSPQAGWAEQNPDDWIAALSSAVNELRSREPRLVDSLAAIGLCSAAHIPVLLDAADRVLRPAILWSDQRAGTEVSELKSDHSPLIEDITLNESSCTWTLPQLLWVWKHEPEVLARARRLLSSKDYVNFRLTGETSMDHGSAAATLMMNGRDKIWATQLQVVSRLPDNAFPALVEPTAIIGKITAEAARMFALPQGTPVIAGTLDSAAEMVGCGLLASRAAGMVRVGSAGGIMVVSDTPTFNKGIITYPHVVDGLYYKQAGTNSCATSLKWIRNFCMAMRPADAPLLTYEDLDRLAAQANPGADGVMFHPYLQGERAPHWNADLRGSFTGIDQRHGWSQFIRAVMEGVAFSLLDCLNLFRRDGLNMTSAVMSGGVVKSHIWSQIITDVLGIETYTVANGDSAFGAGMLAATAVGMFASVNDAVDICVKPARVLRPSENNAELYKALYARYQETGIFLAGIAHKYRV